MDSHKTILVELSSGNIELTSNNQGEPIIQFNCECEDALPYCKAMCCKGRPTYNVLVSPDRKDLCPEPHPDDNDLMILPTEGNCCKYLSNNNMCSVHDNKPKDCMNWHCSPGGVGENIINRCGGWNLRISDLVQQHEIKPD
jgi:hypothetical protein